MTVRPLRSPGVLLVPVLAVGAGLAAALLAGPKGPATTEWVGRGLVIDTLEFSLLIGVPTASAIGYWLYRRFRAGTIPVPGRLMIMALTAILLAVGFIVLAHLVAQAAPTGSGPLPPGASGHGGAGNATQTPTPAGNASANSTARAPLSLGLPSGWPWWIPYLLIGLGAVAVGGFAALAAWPTRGPEGPNPPARPDPGEAMRRGLEELDRGRTEGARGAILGLYARLLEAVGNRAGSLGPKTARELTELLVVEWGIDPTGARRLTELFEQARYSTLPLGPEAVDEARAALEAAVRSLGGAPARAE